jgi:hypothetical protein
VVREGRGSGALSPSDDDLWQKNEASHGLMEEYRSFLPCLLLPRRKNQLSSVESGASINPTGVQRSISLGERYASGAG